MKNLFVAALLLASLFAAAQPGRLTVTNADKGGKVSIDTNLSAKLNSSDTIARWKPLQGNIRVVEASTFPGYTAFSDGLHNFTDTIRGNDEIIIVKGNNTLAGDNPGNRYRDTVQLYLSDAAKNSNKQYTVVAPLGAYVYVRRLNIELSGPESPARIMVPTGGSMTFRCTGPNTGVWPFGRAVVENRPAGKFNSYDAEGANPIFAPGLPPTGIINDTTYSLRANGGWYKNYPSGNITITGSSLYNNDDTLRNLVLNTRTLNGARADLNFGSGTSNLDNLNRMNVYTNRGYSFEDSLGGSFRSTLGRVVLQSPTVVRLAAGDSLQMNANTIVENATTSHTVNTVGFNVNTNSFSIGEYPYASIYSERYEIIGGGLYTNPNGELGNLYAIARGKVTVAATEDESGNGVGFALDNHLNNQTTGSPANLQQATFFSDGHIPLNYKYYPTNGFGDLSFAPKKYVDDAIAAAGGGATPGGSDGDVQYKSGSNLAGSNVLHVDAANGRVLIGDNTGSGTDLTAPTLKVSTNGGSNNPAAIVVESANSYSALISKGALEGDFLLVHNNAPTNQKQFYYRNKNGVVDVINLNDAGAIQNYCYTSRYDGRFSLGYGQDNSGNMSAALSVGNTQGASYGLRVDGNSYLNGSVGISTANPTEKLDVYGNIKTSGYTYYANVSSVPAAPASGCLIYANDNHLWVRCAGDATPVQLH